MIISAQKFYEKAQRRLEIYEHERRNKLYQVQIHKCEKVLEDKVAHASYDELKNGTILIPLDEKPLPELVEVLKKHGYDVHVQDSPCGILLTIPQLVNLESVHL